MKIITVETLIANGEFASSDEWREARNGLHEAVKAVVWPIGSNRFTIHPESGKKSGQGNGVKPIKDECIRRLIKLGWKDEEPLDITTRARPGDLDAILQLPSGFVAMEWETGNVSSSHRALNKMALGLLRGQLVGACLVIPSRAFAKYLTDRIGNFEEIAPYFDLWEAIPCENGVLEVVVIEHDDESKDVPRIPKATDGRALR